ARGLRVAAHKPVVTGSDEPPDPGWPPDHELLARAAGMAPDDVAPVRFGPPVSPHLAAELAGTALDPVAVTARARSAGDGADALVVEGVGGLLVPLGPGASVRDLARRIGLPVVVAARPALGTINHTLLTLEAAAAAGLDVRAVVLGPWPAVPDTVERSNHETIERLAGVAVATLPLLSGPDPAALATAGATLPWRSWL
ncbi:MAG TPA: dethiobiotin synthase, partial [Solirubrobacteraceae bacterium]